MKNILGKILKEVNKKQLYEDIESLWKLELPQTFEAHKQAAEKSFKLLKEAGFENAEIINFPADGKTTYQDKRMPLAWDASVGRLTIKKSSVTFEDPVVADYQRHPFSLVKGSVSTPKGGQFSRLITEAQLFAGEDPAGALVICEPTTVPGAEILNAALDMGALGLLTDYYAQAYREETPDAVSWVNACTEGMHWHVQSDDRPFICFSVTPRVCDKLRHAANVGEVVALVESDGNRHEGVLPAVTASVPGRQKKEFWLMAHLYEPLSDDNSTGVVAAIEMVRIIKKMIAEKELPELEFSIRLVFSAEMYGFAAFADHMGGYLGDKTIGAVNLDSLMAGNPNQKLHVYLAAPGSPFFGNALLEMFVDDCTSKDNFPVAKFYESGWYDDDTFLSDKTVGLPTAWFIGREKIFWHNSMLTMATIDMDIFARTCATIGTWIASVTTLNKEKLPEIVGRAGAYALRHINEEYRRILTQSDCCRYADASERMKYRLQIDVERLNDFKDIASVPEIDHAINIATKAAEQLIEELKNKMPSAKKNETASEKWFSYASTIIPSRTTIGFPYDQIKAPKNQRRDLPDRIIYGPFSRVLSNMDGKKNLQRVIQEAEWEENCIFTDAKIKKYIGAIMYLADYGYLNVDYKKNLEKTEIVEALKTVGVKADDCLFVHSSASAFGHIEGGADVVIDALLKSLGNDGTLLMPTFTVPFASFDGTVNKNRQMRPFDKNNPSQIWVGKIPQSFVQRNGVIRSNHPSHSVAGTGPLAEKCLNEHKENDSPTGKNSPFAKLLELNGKILYFGNGLNASTFLHFLEDYLDLPYLKGSTCRVKDASGEIRTVYVPKNLPGDRDFYHESAENCKFFKRAVAEGLTINEASLGLSKLRLIDVKDFFEIGIKLLKAEPDILLCDKPECLFCVKSKKALRHE